MWVAVIADAKGMLKGCSEIQVDLVETVILRREALTEMRAQSTTATSI